MAQIKICGMRRYEDIEAANALSPDYVGFVFAKSRRQVTVKEACNLRKALDERVYAVGVFVDATPFEVAEIAAICRLSAVQLHGTENREYVKVLRQLLPQDCEIWKAASVKSTEDILAAALSGVNRLLLDAFSPAARGGTGLSFDWGLISTAVIDRPFFVAGGITVDNVEEAVAAAKIAGRPFGLDVSSGVETDGYKDFDKMSKLIAVVRASA